MTPAALPLLAVAVPPVPSPPAGVLFLEVKAARA